MAEINLLQKEVFNRIAAGEVVEGTRSIVKELVENAIDAGAYNVTVEIEDGGIRSVRVTDDGFGIPKSEVRKAFLPHATSKIKNADDMDTIGTLGFRGEALPSIAAVSKVTLKTKFRGESTGTLLRLKGGEEEECGVCAFEIGTSVTVESLFFNTPVRFKFLKSVRGEESGVTSVIQGLILSNPNIAFRYFIDGELRLTSDGTGLPNAVSAIYPASFEDLIPISAKEDGLTLTGYVSDPKLVKGNRSGQTVIINGRVVSETTISATIQNAYRERLMTRTFPIYILDIVMPFDMVDVNVHPSKAEVRLRDARKLYGFLYREIRIALDKRDRNIESSIINFVANTYLNQEKKSEVSADCFDKKQADIKEVQHPQQKTVAPFDSVSFDDAYGSILGKNIFSKGSTVSMQNPFAADERQTYTQLPQRESQKEPWDGNNQNSQNMDILDVILPKNNASKWKIVGQMYRCYLIIECGEKGYILDQHAAHERIIYDELIASAEAERAESQPLLFPYVFQGSSEECEFILKNGETLAKIGFEIDEFGKNTIKVNMIPTALINMNFDGFFRNLLSDMSAIRTLKTSELLRDRLAQLACKSAIKSGDELSTAQISRFIDEYLASGAPLLCPHGRPTILPFDKIDLEKRFKRKI